jgi:hypothetical protein
MGLYKPAPNLNSRATELLIKLKDLLKDDLKEDELSKITALMETYLAKSSSYIVELDDTSLVDRPKLIMPKFMVCNDQALPPPLTGLNYFWDGEFADEGERHRAGLLIEGVLDEHSKQWAGMRARLDTGRMKMRWSSDARRDEIARAGYIYVGPLHGAVVIWGVHDSENNSLYDTRALMTLLQTVVLALNHPRAGRPENIQEMARQCSFWLEQIRAWPHELVFNLEQSPVHSYYSDIYLHLYAKLKMPGFGAVRHDSTIQLATISWKHLSRGDPQPGQGITIEMPPNLMYLKDMFPTDQWKNTTIKEFEPQK